MAKTNVQLKALSDTVSDNLDYVNIPLMTATVTVGTEKQAFANSGVGNTGLVSDSIIVPVGNGVHKVDIYWKVASSTGTLYLTQRTLTVKEL